MIVLDKVADIVGEVVVDNAVDGVSIGKRRFVMLQIPYHIGQ